jgi:hypothetical protein
MHYISNAATRFNLKVATDAEEMQADSWHPANREAGIACRHLLLMTAAQQLGLTRTLQPRSQGRPPCTTTGLRQK